LLLFVAIASATIRVDWVSVAPGGGGIGYTARRFLPPRRRTGDTQYTLSFAVCMRA
jgi:hypothetical protein